MSLSDLTAKRRAFVLAYVGVAAFNASEAARIAGYKSCETEGSRLLRNAAVAREIKRYETRAVAKAEMTAQDVVAWLERVVVGEEGEPAGVDDKGNALVVPAALRDRLKAADMLMKYHHAYDAPDEQPALEASGAVVIEVTGPDDARRQLAALGEK